MVLAVVFVVVVLVVVCVCCCFFVVVAETLRFSCNSPCRQFRHGYVENWMQKHHVGGVHTHGAQNKHL